MKITKKVLIIIFSNLLIFIFLLNILYRLFFENSFEHMQPSEIVLKKNNYNNINIYDYNIEKDTHKRILFNNRHDHDIAQDEYCAEKRIEFNLNYSKKPIVILGCSYAYGHGLKKDESFPFLLSNLTERPVYNFATCGDELLSSFSHLEKYLQDSKNERNNIKNSEYYIYVYMHDHIVRDIQPWRLCKFYNNFYPQNYIYNKIFNVYLFKYIYTRIKLIKMLQNYPYEIKRSKNHLKQIILNSNKRIKEISPNSKLIILIYDEKLQDNLDPDYIKYVSDIINSDIWEDLSKNGIEIIHSKDIIGFDFNKDYKLDVDIDGWHPNKRSWEKLTPLFVDKYIY